MNGRQTIVVALGVVVAAILFALASTHPGCEFISAGGFSGDTVLGCAEMRTTADGVRYVGAAMDYQGTYWALAGAVLALSVLAALSPWGRRSRDTRA